jgi:3-mercaptopyruvate sulfurtransferase SseA
LLGGWDAWQEAGYPTESAVDAREVAVGSRP